MGSLSSFVFKLSSSHDPISKSSPILCYSTFYNSFLEDKGNKEPLKSYYFISLTFFANVYLDLSIPTYN